MVEVLRRYAHAAYSWISGHRKEMLSTAALLCMWLASMFLTQWQSLVFAIGTLLLATDYKILNYLWLERVYDWIEVGPGDIELVSKFWRYQYIDDNIMPLEIKMWDGEDGRAVINNPEGLVENGTRLLICTKDTVGGDAETHEYDLRLGTAEVTSTEPTNSGKSVFLSVEDWMDGHNFEDAEQRNKAKSCQQKLKKGNLEDSPFVKIKRPEELTALGVDQWESLFEEIKDR
ncbi:MAG: hypothetical protein ABEH81_04665 [Halopenitus sp.]